MLLIDTFDDQRKMNLYVNVLLLSNVLFYHIRFEEAARWIWTLFSWSIWCDRYIRIDPLQFHNHIRNHRKWVGDKIFHSRIESAWLTICDSFGSIWFFSFYLVATHCYYFYNVWLKTLAVWQNWMSGNQCLENVSFLRIIVDTSSHSSWKGSVRTVLLL